MHQTYQLPPLCVKLLRENHWLAVFLDYIIINIDTQILSLFFVSNLVDSHSFIQETIKKNGWQMKEKQSWFSVDVIWAVSVLAAFKKSLIKQLGR